MEYENEKEVYSYWLRIKFQAVRENLSVQMKCTAGEKETAANVNN